MQQYYKLKQVSKCFSFKPLRGMPVQFIYIKRLVPVHILLYDKIIAIPVGEVPVPVLITLSATLEIELSIEIAIELTFSIGYDFSTVEFGYDIDHGAYINYDSLNFEKHITLTSNQGCLLNQEIYGMAYLKFEVAVDDTIQVSVTLQSIFKLKYVFF